MSAAPPRPRRRSRRVEHAPPGFLYFPDIVDAGEEARLLRQIERLGFTPFRMRGVDAKREVVHFGARYGFDEGELTAAPAIPTWLAAPLARIRTVAKFPPQGAQLAALVTRYAPGAGIGWHRDAPPFGPVVVGLSLHAACEMRLRNATAGGYDEYRLLLAPRSLYAIAHHARYRWQHAIPPVQALRYSITYRTLRTETAPSAEHGLISRPPHRWACAPFIYPAGFFYIWRRAVPRSVSTIHTAAKRNAICSSSRLFPASTRSTQRGS